MTTVGLIGLRLMGRFRDRPSLDHLMDDEALANRLEQLAARRMVTAAVPIPSMAAALACRDAWRSEKPGTELIAAQRDRFGAHGYERNDGGGRRHSDWRRQ